jgi:subtilase family serine protease
MTRRFLPVFAAAALIVGLAVPAATSAATGHMKPSLVMDAQPVQVAADGPAYGLRTCQVGLSVGQCYDPYQMRTAYGVDKLIAAGYNGRGKTIVIVDAFQDPNIVAQLNTFDAYYGLTPMNAGRGTPTFAQVSPEGLPVYDAGWSEEISLDVLWAHAIAPGANIVLEQAKDNNDSSLIKALNDAVNKKRGDVVSMSFGESDTCVLAADAMAWHQAFVNATLKGITLFASSGDQGVLQPTCDNNSWLKSTSSPASDPLVTAVGGTELHAADYCLASLGCDPTANPGPGTWLSEIAWNEGYPYGDFQDQFDSTLATGGGFSAVFSEPAYQKGTFKSDGLGVPDVAYNGAVLHGVLTYLNLPGVPVGWYRFGGTSAGSPQWAALMAIADQKAGHDLGFINAALYHRISPSRTYYAASLHDILTGTNSALEYDASGNPVDVTGFTAGKGWDATTGFGSPKANKLIPYLVSLVSPGDGIAAIAGSSPHPRGNQSSPGHQKSQ